MAQESESSSGCSSPEYFDAMDCLKYKDQLKRKGEDLLRKGQDKPAALSSYEHLGVRLLCS